MLSGVENCEPVQEQMVSAWAIARAAQAQVIDHAAKKAPTRCSHLQRQQLARHACHAPFHKALLNPIGNNTLCTYLHRQQLARHACHAPFHKALLNPIDNNTLCTYLHRKQLARLVRHQPVLGEAVVKVGQHCSRKVIRADAWVQKQG